MLYVPLQFREYEDEGLLDTGAIQSAMSENEPRRILQAHPAAQLEEYPAPDFKVQIANGNIVPVRKQVLLRFLIGGKIFEETFMILPTMGNILIGMSFFKKFSVTLDLANNIVRFPEITLQLKPNGKFRLQMLELRTTQETTISPGQQIFVHATTNKDIGTVTGTIEAFPAFERKTELLVSPSMSEIKDQQTYVQITNPMDHIITIPQHSTVAVFRILTPNQAKNIQPMTNEQLALITKYPDEASNVINQLFQDPSATNDKRWYPTPETCDDPDKLNKIERRIYDEIIQLREAEKLNPKCDDEQRQLGRLDPHRTRTTEDRSTACQISHDICEAPS